MSDTIIISGLKKNFVPNVFPRGKFNGIAIVGEAAGSDENYWKKPFVGNSGKFVLDPLLKKCGINRDECFVGNLANYQPPRNDDFRTLPTDIQEQGFQLLKSDIEKLNPNIILALGNIPLEKLTNVKGKVSDWRGSILQSSNLDRVYKLIPTYHPAAIARQYDYLPHARFDINRVREESSFPEIILPQRNIKIRPSFAEVMEYLEEVLHQPDTAFDIETGSNNHVTCLGFTLSKSDIMCIPFVCEAGHYWELEQEAEVWRKISQVLYSEKVTKVVHNLAFECYRMHYHYGMKINNIFDTIVASHVLYPEFPNSLAFNASIFTKEPYYKAERKVKERSTREEWNNHYYYNGRDCGVTKEIKDLMEPLLEQQKLRAIYDEELLNFLFGVTMTIRGIKPDLQFMKDTYKKYNDLMASEKTKLELVIGRKINSGSSQQVQKLIYDEMKLPRQYKKDKGARRLTCDVDALLAINYKAQKSELDYIINYRQSQQMRGMVKHKLDPRDKRIHCNFAPLQAGARWSSSKTTLGYGRNVQNIPVRAPHTLRPQIIADDGYLLVEMDEKQIEVRIVGYLAECQAMIDIFEQGRNIHKVNTAGIFGLAESEVDKESNEYYLGKTCCHAVDYNVGPIKLSRKIYKESRIFMPVSKLKEIKANYLKMYPEIPNIFWKEIEVQLRKDRTITNPFGRKIHFWGRLSDADTLSAAYNWIPQSTTSMIVNKVLNRVNLELPQVCTLVHTHDGLLMQVPEDEAKELIQVIYDFFKIPVLIKGVERLFPVEVKTGHSWGLLHEREMVN